MHEEGRPRGAELWKFYACIKRTPESIRSLFSIERLIPNKGGIPYNGSHRWNISGPKRKKILGREMRFGRPKSCRSQSSGINIHAPNFRISVTEIENALRSSREKYTIAAARIEHRIVGLPHRPINQKSRDGVSRVEGSEALL